MCFPSGFVPRGLQLPDYDNKRPLGAPTAGSTLPCLSLSSQRPVCFPPSHGSSVPRCCPMGSPPEKAPAPQDPSLSLSSREFCFLSFTLKPRASNLPISNSSALDQVVHRKMSRCPRPFPADRGVTSHASLRDKPGRGCENASPFTAKPRTVSISGN